MTDELLKNGLPLTSATYVNVDMLNTNDMHTIKTCTHRVWKYEMFEARTHRVRKYEVRATLNIERNIYAQKL